jgi:hypothetical protein
MYNQRLNTHHSVDIDRVRWRLSNRVAHNTNALCQKNMQTVQEERNISDNIYSCALAKNEQHRAQVSCSSTIVNVDFCSCSYYQDIHVAFNE